MEKRILARLHQAIKEKVFPGCAIGITKTHGETNIYAAGNFTYEPDSAPILADTIFDVASITKSIPTSSLALWLIDNGKLSLNDKVIKYLPELQNSYREQITIWHLLTQTLNFGHTSLSSHKKETPQEILNFILTRELQDPPGSTFWYMNSTSIILGLVIERICGKPLDILGAEIYFNPLGMQRTTFHPEKFPLDEIVPTEIDEWRGGLVQGKVHDETAYTLQKEMIPGNAGLFSSAPDLLIFMKMLLQKGTYGGKKFFSESMVEQIQKNQLENIRQFSGLGWELNTPRMMGTGDHSHTFGKSGFTGCLALCNLQKETAMIMLSNTVYPKRSENRAAINSVRSDIADIVFA